MEQEKKPPAPNWEDKLQDWKSQGSVQPIKLITPGLPDQLGEVYIRTLSKQERVGKALKMLGICWGLAVVSVLAPVLHFFLVPAFLLAGPVVGYMAYGRQRIVLGGLVSCPRCEEEMDVHSGAARWPLEELCPGCRTRMSVHQRSGAGS